ncbi:VOC family protein [Lysinibacillus sp. NPDC096418]|uniref:VOC family protein n=1 Tax=Lysinibacillus sp. NPDC096418 TaxID=3364138 RepID=UPI0037F489F1
MIFEITIQVRVTDFKEGRNWYETLLNKKPDYVPHDGFVEWEVIPGCWLQVAEGIPSEASGPLRLGVTNLITERDRLVEKLGIDEFEIYTREEVSAKWGTFTDPWGNQLGLFEYLDKLEENNRIKTVLGV